MQGSIPLCTLPSGKCLLRGAALHDKSDPRPSPQRNVFFLCDDPSEAIRYANREPRRVYKYKANRALRLADLRCLSYAHWVKEQRAYEPQFYNETVVWFLNHAEGAERSLVSTALHKLSWPSCQAPSPEEDRALLAVVLRGGLDGILRRSFSQQQGNAVVDEYLLSTDEMTRPTEQAQRAAEQVNATPEDSQPHQQSDAPLAYVGFEDGRGQ